MDSSASREASEERTGLLPPQTRSISRSSSGSGPDRVKPLGSTSSKMLTSRPTLDVAPPAPPRTALETAFAPRVKSNWFPNGQTARAATYAEVALAASLGIFGVGSRELLAMQQMPALVPEFFALGVLAHAAFQARVWLSAEAKYTQVVETSMARLAKLHSELEACESISSSNAGSSAVSGDAYLAMRRAKLRREINAVNKTLNAESQEIMYQRMRAGRDLVCHVVNTCVVGMARSGFQFAGFTNALKQAHEAGQAASLAHSVGAHGPVALAGGTAVATYGVTQAVLSLSMIGTIINLPVGVMETIDARRDNKVAERNQTTHTAAGAAIIVNREQVAARSQAFLAETGDMTEEERKQNQQHRLLDSLSYSVSSNLAYRRAELAHAQRVARSNSHVKLFRGTMNFTLSATSSGLAAAAIAATAVGVTVAAGVATAGIGIAATLGVVALAFYGNFAVNNSRQKHAALSEQARATVARRVSEHTDLETLASLLDKSQDISGAKSSSSLILFDRIADSVDCPDMSWRTWKPVLKSRLNTLTGRKEFVEHLRKNEYFAIEFLSRALVETPPDQWHNSPMASKAIEILKGAGLSDGEIEAMKPTANSGINHAEALRQKITTRLGFRYLHPMKLEGKSSVEQKSNHFKKLLNEDGAQVDAVLAKLETDLEALDKKAGTPATGLFNADADNLVRDARDALLATGIDFRKYQGAGLDTLIYAYEAAKPKKSDSAKVVQKKTEKCGVKNRAEMLLLAALLDSNTAVQQAVRAPLPGGNIRDLSNTVDADFLKHLLAASKKGVDDPAQEFFKRMDCTKAATRALKLQARLERFIEWNAEGVADLIGRDADLKKKFGNLAPVEKTGQRSPAPSLVTAVETAKAILQRLKEEEASRPRPDAATQAPLLKADFISNMFTALRKGGYGKFHIKNEDLAADEQKLSGTMAHLLTNYPALLDPQGSQENFLKARDELATILKSVEEMEDEDLPAEFKTDHSFISRGSGHKFNNDLPRLGLRAKQMRERLMDDEDFAVDVKAARIKQLELCKADMAQAEKNVKKVHHKSIIRRAKALFRRDVAYERDKDQLAEWRAIAEPQIDRELDYLRSASPIQRIDEDIEKKIADIKSHEQSFDASSERLREHVASAHEELDETVATHLSNSRTLIDQHLQRGQLTGYKIDHWIGQTGCGTSAAAASVIPAVAKDFFNVRTSLDRFTTAGRRFGALESVYKARICDALRSADRTNHDALALVERLDGLATMAVSGTRAIELAAAALHLEQTASAARSQGSANLVKQALVSAKEALHGHHINSRLTHLTRDFEAERVSNSQAAVQVAQIMADFAEERTALLVEWLDPEAAKAKAKAESERLIQAAQATVGPLPTSSVMMGSAAVAEGSLIDISDVPDASTSGSLEVVPAEDPDTLAGWITNARQHFQASSQAVNRLGSSSHSRLRRTRMLASAGQCIALCSKMQGGAVSDDDLQQLFKLVRETEIHANVRIKWKKRSGGSRSEGPNAAETEFAWKLDALQRKLKDKNIDNERAAIECARTLSHVLRSATTRLERPADQQTHTSEDALLAQPGLAASSGQLEAPPRRPVSVRKDARIARPELDPMVQTLAFLGNEAPNVLRARIHTVAEAQWSTQRDPRYSVEMWQRAGQELIHGEQNINGYDALVAARKSVNEALEVLGNNKHRGAADRFEFRRLHRRRRDLAKAGERVLALISALEKKVPPYLLEAIADGNRTEAVLKNFHIFASKEHLTVLCAAATSVCSAAQSLMMEEDDPRHLKVALGASEVIIHSGLLKAEDRAKYEEWIVKSNNHSHFTFDAAKFARLSSYMAKSIIQKKGARREKALPTRLAADAKGWARDHFNLVRLYVAPHSVAPGSVPAVAA